MTTMAELSKNGKGDVRLDYEKDGRKIIRIWENISGTLLETTFKEDGSITSQRVISDKKVEDTNMVFSKPCPSCSNRSLVRYTEAYRNAMNVPIMPMYHCTECRGKS